MAKSIIEQIADLDAQKQELMTKAKNEALATAQKAVADLNSLGFHFTLVEMAGSTSRAPRATGTRSPRTGGATAQLLELLKAAPKGLPKSGILDQMQATDDKAKNNISTTLFNMKKRGQVSLENGVYRAI